MSDLPQEHQISSHYEHGLILFDSPEDQQSQDRANREKRDQELKEEQAAIAREQVRIAGVQTSIQNRTLITQIFLVVFGLVGLAIGYRQTHLAAISTEAARVASEVAKQSLDESRRSSLEQAKEAREAAAKQEKLAKDSIGATVAQSQKAIEASAEQANLSLEASTESLVSVQRAFMTFEKLIPRLVLQPTPIGLQQRLSFRAVWQNDGTTPAIEIFQYFHTSAITTEPDENAFLGIVKLNGVFSGTFKGPKATLESHERSYDADLFPMPSVNGQPPIVAISKHSFAFWGWVAYRDIFKNTKIHVSEFCQQLNNAERSSTGEIITMSMDSCGHHNCQDESCADYARVVAIYKRE